MWERDIAIAIGVAVALQGAFGLLYGLYRRRWRYGSFDEVRIVALTALSVGIVMTALWWGGSDTATRSVPRSVPLLATAISLLGQIAVRSMWRLYTEHRDRPEGDHLPRLVIVGAGEAAEQVLRTMRSSSTAPYVPVAMVDDDPAKRNLRMSGVRVEGRVDELVSVAEHRGATAVLIAVPSAESPFIRRVTALADGAGLEVFVLPPVDKMLGGVHVTDIRPVNEDDLLGRHPADIDPEAVSEYITGRRVLVTGAGGSIGSELCRQLVRFEPAELFMLDRDESGLHATQLSIEGRAMLDNPNLILADIRDPGRMDEIFGTYRPDVVFHAAALKHLPLLEMHPSEGWKTNVGGTQVVLDAARRHGVQRLVNISTDKAADPTSVLGWTKRITERLTAYASQQGPIECVSVRFGNVLGSNGSVLRSFESQAANGGPITVTHPDITRYFMTIEEASKLTIYAGAIGAPGEVLILDMGDPVRIFDVAQRFATLHDPPIEIVFTGLRPNEKLHEDLIAVVRARRMPGSSADHARRGRAVGAAAGDVRQVRSRRSTSSVRSRCRTFPARSTRDGCADRVIRADLPQLARRRAASNARRCCGRSTAGGSRRSGPNSTPSRPTSRRSSGGRAWWRCRVALLPCISRSLVHGVGAGDEVIVSTFTFAATANAVTYLGATPRFVDSDTATWNMNPELLADELAAMRAAGRLPAAVVVVDLYGQCADYDEIVPLCAEYGVPVVEDAAEALGASYRGRSAGTFGDCGIFSFNGNKIMTTSGGGAFVSPDVAVADRVRYLATQARQPAVHYEHTEVGFNYRLSNLLAAMGRAQLARLPEMSARRLTINRCYREALEAIARVVVHADVVARAGTAG